MKSNEFEKVGDLLARQYKISIRKGRSWCCNIKNRVVYYIDQDIHELPEDHILGLLLHEIAHIHYTTAPEYPTFNKELSQVTMNMIEDIAIEHIIGNDYPNAGEILESTTQEVLDQLIKILPKLEESEHEKALLYASTRFQGRGYSTNITKYEIVGQEISEVMIKNKDNILNRKQTSDLLPIVKEIVDILIARLGQPSEADKNRMSFDSRKQTEGDEIQEDDGATPSRRGLVKAMGAKPGNSNSAMPHPDIEYMGNIVDQAGIIGRRLRTILKRNNAMEFGGRYRTGKILPKRLVRMKVLKDKRAFAKRVVKSNQSYAFALTCDVSGSMFGCREDPASNAMNSMYMVSEALRTAGIPRSVSIFGQKAKVLAKMSKNGITWDQLVQANVIRNTGQGCTNIELGMEKCIEELKTTKAERKVMIVLTDGSGNDDDVRDMYDLAKTQKIECIGITLGNCDGTLGEVFGAKNNIVLENANKIGEAFIKILKQTITVSEGQ